MLKLKATKQPQRKASKHLAYIRTLPCLLCGQYGVDAAHIRYSDFRFGKPAPGMGEKPDDKWTVPLCRPHHTEQHSMDERKFWIAHKKDPVAIANWLWENNDAR